MKLSLVSFVFGLGALPQVSAFAPHHHHKLAESSTWTKSTTELYAERKPFITGNWKLNPTTKQEAIDLATGIAEAVTNDSPGDVALFVPYPFIETVQKCVGDKMVVGAEVSVHIRIIYKKAASIEYLVVVSLLERSLLWITFVASDTTG